MKNIINTCLLATQIFMGSAAYAESNDTQNAQARFNEVRSDIALWIKQGGAKNLELSTVEYDEYVSKMSSVLEERKVVVGFIEKDDASNDELKVNIDGSPKTCRGFISARDSKAHIICNLARFNNTDEASQYRLVHHEFAGLMGIERNDGASSDYSVSSQITSYLSRQSVLKLAVKKGESIEKGDPAITMTKNRYVGNDIFEITLEVKNTKNILQVVLDDGEFEERMNTKCRSQAPRQEFKNGNFSITFKLNKKLCPTKDRYFKFDKVLVQYLDGTMQIYSAFESKHGFNSYTNATNVKGSVEILREVLGTEKHYSSDNIIKTKDVDVKVKYSVNAKDMENYYGVVLSDGSEFFSDDANKIADFINTKEIVENLKINQVVRSAKVCKMGTLFCKWEEVKYDKFEIYSAGSVSYIMLLKKTAKVSVDILRINEAAGAFSIIEDQK